MTPRRRHSSSSSSPSSRPDTGDPTTRRPSGGPGGDGLDVDTDGIDSMAGRLQHTGGRVDAVGTALDGIDVGPQSMGIVGSGFTGAAQSHVQTARQHVTRTRQAVDNAQTGTSATARSYRDTDTTNAQNLGGIDTATDVPAAHGGSTTTPSSSTGTPGGGTSAPPATHDPGTTTPSGSTGAPGGPANPPPTIGDRLGGSDDGSGPPPPPGPPGGPPPINHRNPDGSPIRTDDLAHPNANLMDRSLLDAAASNPNRVSDALRPGVDLNHPDVQNIVGTSYHRDGFDASGNPMDRAQWDSQYWPSGGYDAHGGRDLAWPDPAHHPEGFSSPEDRVPAVLNPGETIDRFGPGFGRFTSPPSTPFPERGLPPDNLYDMRDPSGGGVTPNAPMPSYHRYEVVRPIPVWSGPIAEAMGQPGGGTQYYMPTAVVDLVNAGYLREVPL